MKKKSFVLLSIILLGIVSYSQITTSTYAGIQRVALYVDINYMGRQMLLTAGQYNVTDIDKEIGDNKLSSLKIPSGYEVTLFEYPDFQGASIALYGDVNSLVSLNWNNRVSSLIIKKNDRNNIEEKNINSQNAIMGLIGLIEQPKNIMDAVYLPQINNKPEIIPLKDFFPDKVTNFGDWKIESKRHVTMDAKIASQYICFSDKATTYVAANHYSALGNQKITYKNCGILKDETYTFKPKKNFKGITERMKFDTYTEVDKGKFDIGNGSTYVTYTLFFKPVNYDELYVKKETFYTVIPYDGRDFQTQIGIVGQKYSFEVSTEYENSSQKIKEWSVELSQEFGFNIEAVELKFSAKEGFKYTKTDTKSEKHGTKTTIEVVIPEGKKAVRVQSFALVTKYTIVDKEGKLYDPQKIGVYKPLYKTSSSASYSWYY